MKKITTIARITMLEIIHEKIFFVFVFVAALLIALSALLGNLSFDEQRKILADFSYLSIQLAGMGISLFFGAYIISREIEKQTCLLILSRPLSRAQFIFGKFFGLTAINTLLFIVLYCVLGVLLSLKGYEQWLNHGVIISLLWGEVLLALALAMFFALVVRPLISLLMTFSIFLFGSWIPDLFFFAKESKAENFQDIVHLIDLIMPNFYKFHMHSSYYLEQGIPLEKAGLAHLHVLGWAGLLLVFIGVIFRRKDVI